VVGIKCPVESVKQQRLEVKSDGEWSQYMASLTHKKSNGNQHGSSDPNKSLRIINTIQNTIILVLTCNSHKSFINTYNLTSR